MTFVRQLFRIHFGWRCHPQTYRDVGFTFQEFGSGAEVADVGHTRTDEHFVDFGAGAFRHEAHVVWVVRASNNRLFNVVHVDFNHGGVFGIFICFEQLRICQPCFHGFDTAFQSARILIAVGNHVFHQHNIGFHVLDNRLFVELHSTACSGAFGRCVGQFKGLFHFQIRQAFDFEDAAGEDVFLTGFGNGQQALFNRVQRNGVHQVTQGYAWLQFAAEAYQYGLRHIEWHHAGSCCESNQAGAGRERNTDRETGVAVAAGTNCIRQQQTVEP